MTPAPSVILFTTLSGAGFGLLAWLGLLTPAGLVGLAPAGGLAAVALALALIGAGLLASTAHLGHPERAWRAFSQWRSSWLSREGVAAVATFAPALGFSGAWFGAGPATAAGVVLGVASAVLAVVTVLCTGMIYASLRAVRQWHLALVPVNYLLFAAASGAVLLAMLEALAGPARPGPALFAVVLLLVALVAKRAYWRRIDAQVPTSTPESATGLGAIGRVRLLEPPHQTDNYLLKEMGYAIARRHAARLRGLAAAAGFAAPAVLLALASLAGGRAAAVGGVLAAIAMFAGLLVERWLFFAEATHSVVLYYGRR
jgi:DMSO reductase anchor subunit